tara:strand:- start:122 stop:391 length:270 start_codon:yes stop_codon:yes gene_type:complete
MYIIVNFNFRGIMKKTEAKTKKFQIDITDFEDLQDAIVEYFILMSEILDKKDFQIQSVILDIDSNKIIVEGNNIEDEKEEESEFDLEWI